MKLLTQITLLLLCVAIKLPCYGRNNCCVVYIHYNYLDTNGRTSFEITMGALYIASDSITVYRYRRKVAFMGSMNETYSGWGKGGNYEIAWVDDDQEAIEWVQYEFDNFRLARSYFVGI